MMVFNRNCTLPGRASVFLLLLVLGPCFCTFAQSPEAKSDSAKVKGKLAALASKKAGDLKQKLQKLKPDSNLFDPKVAFDLSAENKGMYQQGSPSDSGAPGYMNGLGVNFGFSVNKIPFSVEYSNLLTLGAPLGRRQMNNQFRVGLDKGVYSRFGKGQLQKYTAMKKQFSGASITDYAQTLLKDKLKDQLQDSLASLLPAMNGLLMGYLSDPENLQSLLHLEAADMKAFLKDFVTEHQSAARQKLQAVTGKAKDSLTTLIPGDGELPAEADIKNKALENEWVKKNGELLTSLVNSVKKKIEPLGLDLKTALAIESKLAEGNLSGEELLDLVPSQTGPGKFFYQAFSKVKDLKTGSFGSKIPGNAFNDQQYLKGISVTLNALMQASAGFAALKDIGSAKDAGFSSSVFSAPRNIAYLSLRTNRSALFNGKLTWVNASTVNNAYANVRQTVLSRNTMAFTLSQEMNLGKPGKITADISKSANLFRNTLTGPDQVPITRNLLGYYLSDVDPETFSMGLTHEMDHKRLNLSDKVYFNYSGAGYQNPATNGYSSVKTRMGGSLKKRMLHNRFTVNLRTDLQTTPVNASASDKWKNYQFQADGRWQLKGSSNVSFKYMANGTSRISDVRTPYYRSEKLQAGMNTSYKLGKWYGGSYFTLSHQQLRDTYQSATSSGLLTMNYSQTVVMDKNSFTGTLLYTKENSAYTLVGDMVNADLGMQYTLFKKISASTAATYLDNQTMAKQAGFRQSIQLLSKGAFAMDSYIDVRKNLRTPLYPVLYPSCKGELTLRYTLGLKNTKL